MGFPKKISTISKFRIKQENKDGNFEKLINSNNNNGKILGKIEGANKNN